MTGWQPPPGTPPPGQGLRIALAALLRQRAQPGKPAPAVQQANAQPMPQRKYPGEGG